MKKKATTRRVIVRNSEFIAVVTESAAERKERSVRIAEHAVSSGIVKKLSDSRQKAAGATAKK